MVRAVRFVRRRYINHFPKIVKAVTTGSDNFDKIVERFVATTALIAKRSMRKAPKRPKSRFGTLKAYSKNSKKYGRFYWQKGMYSRPGQPPFWVERSDGKTLRRMHYFRVRMMRSSHGGGYTQWRVGPLQYGNSQVPGLHEHGGTVRTRYNSYLNRGGQRIRRPTTQRAHYPRRPYMEPAVRMAKRYTQGGRHFIDRINTLGGLRATRRAS